MPDLLEARRHLDVILAGLAAARRDERDMADLRVLHAARHMFFNFVVPASRHYRNERNARLYIKSVIKFLFGQSWLNSVRERVAHIRGVYPVIIIEPFLKRENADNFVNKLLYFFYALLPPRPDLRGDEVYHGYIISFCNSGDSHIEAGKIYEYDEGRSDILYVMFDSAEGRPYVCQFQEHLVYPHDRDLLIIAYYMNARFLESSASDATEFNIQDFFDLPDKVTPVNFARQLSGHYDYSIVEGPGQVIFTQCAL